MSTDAVPFDSLSFSDKQLVYRGLLCLVKSNSGYGFCNNDQGHPAYAVGRSGTVDHDQFGDSPERNHLFRMMHTLSVDLSAGEIDESSEIEEYVFCWADFCNLAYGAYQESRGGGRQ
jgi:hypothetical protein